MSDTQLYARFGLHFDTVTNTLLISNSNTNNIVRYIKGSNKWTVVASNINGARGSTSSTFSCPIDVTLDATENMYIIDDCNQRVQFFLMNKRMAQQ